MQMSRIAAVICILISEQASALTACNGLIDELLQRLRLLLAGYRADNRLAYNVAVFVNHICGGIGVQSGGKFSGLTF